MSDKKQAITESQQGAVRSHQPAKTSSDRSCRKTSIGSHSRRSLPRFAWQWSSAIPRRSGRLALNTSAQKTIREATTSRRHLSGVNYAHCED